MKSIVGAMGSVVRVETSTRDPRTGRSYFSCAATGFFYANSSQELYLVTNKHVIRDEKKAHFPEILIVHIPVLKSRATRATKTLELRLHDRHTRRKLWQTPKDPRVDIAAVKINRGAVKIDVSEKAFYTYLSGKDALPKGAELTIGSPAVVLGFPESPEPDKIQFYDESLNFPIARFGSIATLPQFPFNKKRYFLVDAKLHHGMSGSPVVSLPGSPSTKDGEIILDDVESYLVGILSAGWPYLELNAVWPARLIEEATQNVVSQSSAE
jgi:S1-C subfamily serine protease